MDSISNVFVSVLLYTSMNRLVDENWLCGAHNRCKLHVKKDISDVLTSHQQQVADAFNTISGLLPIAILNELTDGNTENVESI